jgi:PelA/Pel-15E family pectate lyase
MESRRAMNMKRASMINRRQGQRSLECGDEAYYSISSPLLFERKSCDKSQHSKWATLISLALLIVANATGQSNAIKWSDCLRQPPAFYASDEAVRIADNALLYQRESGGWPKNVDIAATLSERQKAEIAKEKSEIDSTIDNGATCSEMIYLARVYAARKLDRHKESFLGGLDYLLRAQYANGGWPQYHPRLTGYYKHITFNDDAMMGVMKLLRDIAAKKSDYSFTDEDRRARAERAVEKGIECIVKTQIRIGGKLTAWCAQHDEITLAPARARAYEPASLSGDESVEVVRFLMGIENPSREIIAAIESAVAWFEKTKITGNRIDHTIARDHAASPLWARFYEIGTDRPIFTGRDGVVKYHLSEIEAERRNNYRWYTNAPAKLIEEDYSAWRRKRGL